MRRLKLFENFEENLFYKINTEDWLCYFEYAILFKEYHFNLLKRRLSNIFGHSDFFFEIEKKSGDYPECIHIYERLNSLVYYNIYLIEDDWFYIKSQNRVLVFTNINHYYRSDGINGAIEAIKYDFEEINKKVSLYCKLPSRQGIYGLENVKNQFFDGEKILLDTYRVFPISDFPEEEVDKIIPDIYLPNDRDIYLPNDRDFLDLNVDGKLAKLTCNKNTIDLYYIKETNRFNCANLSNSTYYACVGAEGLKRFLSVFFKSNIDI